MIQQRKSNIRRKRRFSTQTSRTRHLAVRRRVIYFRKIMLGFIFAVFVIVLVIIGLNQPVFRVTQITIIPSHSIANNTKLSLMRDMLSKEYFGIIPYNSVLFLNTKYIRNLILTAKPTIAAVSITHIGFNTITITLEPRTPFARWCGTVASSTPADTLLQDIHPSQNNSCYLFDSNGFLYQKTISLIYATSSTNAIISSTTPMFPYVVYARLVATTTPYQNTIIYKSALPNIFDFAQHIKTFNATVFAIVLRGSEVDFFLTDGTRITYVRGKEQQAFILLNSSKQSISISNGSLDYVDLRFPGKIYFKKKNILQ